MPLVLCMKYKQFSACCVHWHAISVKDELGQKQPIAVLDKLQEEYDTAAQFCTAVLQH